MNAAVVSGIRKGDLSEAPNEGIRFTLLTTGNQGHHDEFEVVAYGQSAAFIEHNTSSGDRIVVFGRVSSDRLGTDQFHHVINTTRVLSTGESDKGVDFNFAVVSGESEIDAVQQTERSQFARISTRNLRHYQDQVFTSFVNGTAWGERADALASEVGNLPAKNVPMVYEGMMRPRTYQNDEGLDIHKIDIWVQEYSLASGVQTSTAQQSSTTKPPAQQKQYATKSAAAAPSTSIVEDDEDDLPF